MIIYKVTNTVNGKVYIGATRLSLEKRMCDHFRFAFRKDRKKGYFQEAIIKYGKDSFAYEVIDEADTLDEMYEKEQYWISYYNSTDSRYGYNLDSGGIYCKKSDSTKRKIGDTTIEKWKNEDISRRMLNGLRKGTETWKKMCNDNRIKFVCPECGQVLYLRPYETKHKKYCSMKCAVAAGVYKAAAIKASEKTSVIAHTNNMINKVEAGEDIIDWAFTNKQYVLDCPLNDITNHLKPLTDILYEKYGIFDLRSYYICLGVLSKKQFIKSLKNIVSEENIC